MHDNSLVCAYNNITPLSGECLSGNCVPLNDRLDVQRE